MSKLTARVDVHGPVYRDVIVSGNSVAELEAAAQQEWSNLVGGQVGNAEVIEIHILEKEKNNEV
jgi:hypothetical protein